MIVIIERRARILMRRLTFGLLLLREPNDSVSKASWPHVTSDLSAFSLNMEKLPTNLNYPLTFPEYMMYFTCHNSGVASRTPSAKSTMNGWRSKMSFLGVAGLCLFLIPQRVRRVLGRARCSTWV